MLRLVKDLLVEKGTFVASVSPFAKVIDAAREMSERKIGSLVVVIDQRVAGIVTERDLLTRVVAQARDARTTEVLAVMTREVVVCRPDATLDDCKRIISLHRLRHLPVVDDENGVAGIVTSGDILQCELAEQGDAIETLRTYLYGSLRKPSATSRSN